MVLASLFGTHSDHEIKKIEPIKKKVLALEEEYSKLSDTDLRAKTDEFKSRLANGETLDDILPEAFATVREASWRVLGLKPYPVQIIGGIVLHQGRIAEMKTGEGKTLVATMPVYLNALTGKGVHVVTVNDYLAKRDSEWMGKVYKFLGLTVGLIIHDIPNKDRKAMYASDIVYGTNNEFGFDYLRDNMVVSKKQLVQRELNYAIVDEVDSILIDEARTPLIISGRGEASSDLYQKADAFVRMLKPYTVVETDDKIDMDELVGDADYVIDEKAKTSVITANGIKKAEAYFNVQNLSDPENFDLQHYINNALKAHGNFHKDEQYIVTEEGEVVIVDDFTGRLMPGRRYSDGLHQSIEAKEGVKVANENKTLATITFQNFFRMYDKLSGMTGTAYTEEAEFRQIYNLDVITIPTNKPIQRVDENDAVFKTQKGKYHAVLKTVIEVHKTGQPVLVGTVNVDKSEYLDKLFRKAGIQANVLNAKNHRREAEIVAQAGRKNAVTIATNMAGRGTDILLGGNPEFLAKQEMRKLGYDEDMIEASTAHNETDDELILEARKKYAEIYEKKAEEIKPEADEVRALGGLYIVGTERHESRRIDNQLKGRAGRQGDPGRTKFFLALDDDLLRIFGGDRVNGLYNSLGVDETMEIQNGMLTKLIDSSQKKLEAVHFGARKNVLEYDDVMNIQRTITYEQRRKVIDGEDMHDTLLKMLEKVAERQVMAFANDGVISSSERYSLGTKLAEIFGELPIVLDIRDESKELPEPNEIISSLYSQSLDSLSAKEAMVGTDIFRQTERSILLMTVDTKWMDHIDSMDQLQTSIRMRSIGQHDPVVEYKKEGGEMFEEMNEAIQNDAVKLLMRGKFELRNNAPSGSSEEGQNNEADQNPDMASPLARAAARATASQKAVPAQAKQVEGAAQSNQTYEPVKRDKNKVGRNDPCPCGSGKKYKNCCGKNA
ncbi:MAG: preprotein translocase subunit SecA [Clostridiales bacterium]|nr:preprotein translocase subunit SecA [Clostridiales bacterium]